MPEAPSAPLFNALFEAMPEASGDAPGRVNLIGEHTDYHDGFVLPTAIPQRTYVEARRRHDRRVRVWSEGHGDEIQEFVVGDESRVGSWIDYIAGVTYAVRAAGLSVGGFDARVASDVPIGAGLSSSASLEVSLLRAVRTLFGLVMDDVQLAQIAQAAEVDFVGAPVGIMDPMAASLAAQREGLFLDTRNLSYERLPIPAAAAIVVISSGVVHHHAGGDYAERRAESEEAARLLGVRRLRDVSVRDVERLSALPPLLARRARHVITENDRVVAAAEALRDGDLQRLGQLFQTSHVSMRDDYDVSIPEIDALVECATDDPDVFGARLTGGGFGGAVVILARADHAANAAERIKTRYSQRTGRDGRVLLTE